MDPDQTAPIGSGFTGFASMIEVVWSVFKKLIQFLEWLWNHEYFGLHLLCKRQILRASLTLQETRSIHDSMNIPKIEFIAYIYISV